MKMWKITMFIPVIFLIIMSGFLIYKYSTTGEFIDRSVELKGGQLITMIVDPNSKTQNIENLFTDVKVRVTKGAETVVLLETSEDASVDEIIKKLEENNVKIIGEPTIKKIGPVLGELFFQQAQTAVALAMIFMGIVVFVLFRTMAPSLAVIFAAITDMIITFSVLSFFGVKLSMSIIAGLLMLIGYSIDTDILLTTRVLKRKGENIEKRILSAMKTGLTMTATTLAALISMFIFSNTPVIQEISMVLIIGLLVDIASTYLTNVGILRWYIGE